MGDLHRRGFIAALGAVGASGCFAPASPVRKRNILLIVADDIGFTDLGAYGSEIPTPHLDQLAGSGAIFTDFHTGMTCSPTRAMLMSGVDHHRSGLGNMAEDMAENQIGNPGYEGHLNFSVAALPEVLKLAGYRTAMAGKWHLGLTPETGPAARGFDRSFSLLQGGAGHFDTMPMVGPGVAKYSRDGQPLEVLAEDYYSTDAFAGALIGFLQEGDQNKPFFGYLAFTAPHWPVQAPRASIEAHRGRYDDGYDALFERRLAAGKAAGVIPASATGADRAPGGRPWSDLTADEQAYEARRMEAYAAMVSDLDSAVGRLFAWLDQTGLRDNTLIIFMGDNGYEGHDLHDGFREAAQWAGECCDNSLDNLGMGDSYVWMGPDWSRASNPVFRFFKGFPSEGGTRAPAVVSFPGQTRKGAVNGFAHVKDVFATALDWAGAGIDPAAFPDRKLIQPDGVSLVPYLQGAASQIHADDTVFAQELFGKRAIRQGQWKASLMPPPYGDATWQLFDLAADLGETRNLASSEPERLALLVAQWDRWAAAHGVILPDRVSGY